MTVTPTCRFCHKTIVVTWLGKRPPFADNSLGDYSHYSHYWCKLCQSEQIYMNDGRPVDWSFVVSNYMLYFWPGHNFTIFQLENERIGKPILTTKSVPVKMTPQNTTEERIKLLILFS